MKISSVTAHSFEWALFDRSVSVQDNPQVSNESSSASRHRSHGHCVRFVAFAQSSSSLSDVPIESTTPNASVAQNFQYMNHPPVAAPASSTAQTQGGRGHRRRQSTGTADSSGADSSQP
jgi:hypothetical protein